MGDEEDYVWKNFENYAISHAKELVQGLQWSMSWDDVDLDDHLLRSGLCASAQDIAKTFGRFRYDTKARRQYGFDGLARHSDGFYVGLEAKYRKKLSTRDLDTTLEMIQKLKKNDERCRGIVFVKNDTVVELSISNMPFIEIIRIPFEPDGKSWPPLRQQRAPRHTIDRAMVTLNEPQAITVDTLMKVCHEGKPMLIDLPTGMGKTLVASEFLCRYHPWNTVIVISNLKEIVEQTTHRIRSYCKIPDIMIFHSDHTTSIDDEWVAQKRDLKKIIGITDKTWRLQKAARLCDGDTIVIYDECHKMTKDIAQELCTLAQAGTKVILMSATPKELKIIRVSPRLTLGQCIEKGHLSDYQVHVTVGDFIESIASTIKRCNLMKLLVFAGGTGACHKVKEALEARKDIRFRVGIITYRESPEERRMTIDQFESNDDGVSVVINVNIMREAMDLRRVDAVVINNLSKQKTILTQQVGRGIRIEPDRKNKVALIVIHNDDQQTVCDRIETIVSGLGDRSHTKPRIRLRGPEPSYDIALSRKIFHPKIILAPTSGFKGNWLKTMRVPDATGRYTWGFRDSVMGSRLISVGSLILFYASRKFYYAMSVVHVNYDAGKEAQKLWGDSSFTTVVYGSRLIVIVPGPITSPFVVQKSRLLDQKDLIQKEKYSFLVEPVDKLFLLSQGSCAY